MCERLHTYTAGQSEHELSSYSSIDSVFEFLSERYKAVTLFDQTDDISHADGLLGYAFNERAYTCFYLNVAVALEILAVVIICRLCIVYYTKCIVTKQLKLEARSFR